MLRLEAIARALVLRLDVAIYRAQREQTPGQYAGLAVLLPLLRQQGVLDEAALRYLTALLTKPAGHRLRHDMVHGFVANAGLGGAALLLHAALLLATVNPDESQRGSPDGDGEVPPID